MSQYNKTELHFIKLYDSFMNSDPIIWIEKQKDGEIIVNLLLKLMLIAKNRDGKLVRIVGEIEDPYTIKEMAIETRQSEEMIVKGLETLIKAGLVVKENNIYKIPLALKYTNQTTIGAEKKILQRRKKADKCPPDIEVEAETENRNKKKEEEDKLIIEKDVCGEVIQYLNYVLKTSYKIDNQEICSLVNERVSDGYEAKDMKNVILFKYEKWQGTKYATGLRPQTLLGEKFGMYLEEYKESHKYDHLYANI